jgi:hypothetical protein
VDPELYKIVGELQGSVGKLEGTIGGVVTAVDNANSKIDKISDKLDNLSVVPYSVFENRIKSSDERFKNIECDVNNIKIKLRLNDNSFTGRLSTFMNSAIVKLIGGATITLLLMAMYLTYTQQIDKFQDTINQINTRSNIVK